MNLFPVYVTTLLTLNLVAPQNATASDFQYEEPDEKKAVVTAGFDDFDRLDGMGKSAKKVNVIEWEGNLEIHVYPKGSLAGLALKLTENDQKKNIMVIGYRFNPNPKDALIRRAILGIPLKPGFKAFQDLSAVDYDKIIISNHGLALSSSLLAFKLDPEPKQLYPDGHPALLAEKEAATPRAPAGASSRGPTASAVPAAAEYGEQPAEHWRPAAAKSTPPPQFNEDTGTIRPFGF